MIYERERRREDLSVGRRERNRDLEDREMILRLQMRGKKKRRPRS